MELVSQTTTTVTKDERVFKSTSPNGEVYYTTDTAESRETDSATQDAKDPARVRLKATTRTKLGSKVHRMSPYLSRRTRRTLVASDSKTTSVTRKGIVRLNES